MNIRIIGRNEPTAGIVSRLFNASNKGVFDGKYITPYLAEIIRNIREMGGFAIKHTDGNIMPILDQIAACSHIQSYVLILIEDKRSSSSIKLVFCHFHFFLRYLAPTFVDLDRLS